LSLDKFNFMKKMKIFRSLSLIVFCVFILLSCSDKTAEEPIAAPQKTILKRAEVSYLNESYARLRKKQVDDVRYKLIFNLSADENEFLGSAEIEFELLNTNQALTVDFTNGKVEELILNGSVVDFTYNNWFISIDESLLERGPQHLSIKFSHPYSLTGSGLYRSIDPEDGFAYIYSDLEPYDANRIFPSFDQPDLKATYDMQVEVPADWQVITARRESEIIEKGERNVWGFPVSDNFSTYIFSLHAGPYKVWEDNSASVPLRLMARQTLAKYVNVEEWFEISRQGFEFFEKYFEVDYPFHKYDQIIVPDFNSGAMENVGAVTFSERYIKRGSYTIEERERIANVVLHEMAHMWFGNLVTMDWWNGLWLNESFATYMAYLAATENTKFKQSWHTFYSRTKLWAYNTDEQVTNHPIELPVNNTESGFANFDGITYGKGASVLKQLSYLIEPEVFRQGVSQYLKDKSYGNSVLDDFMSAMEKSSKRDLDEWTRQWLYIKGTNKITTNYQCEDGKISKFALTQESQEAESELREHRLQLGLYNVAENNKIKLVETLAATIHGSSTDIYDLIDLPCPDFVYPNHDDWAFVKVALPERELAILKSNINGFSDPMIRSMLWRNLWEAVRDARLPLTEYAEIVLANISAENDLKTLNQVTGSISSTLSYLYLFQMDDAAIRDRYLRGFESLAWNKLSELDGQVDLQMIWFDHYLYIAHSAESLARLKSLLNGELKIARLNPDQDRRWAMVHRLSAHAYMGIEDVLERERKRDPSSSGEKAYIAAQSAAPNIDNKETWLQEIQKENTDLALAKLRAAMGSLYPAYQVEYRKALLAEALRPLAQLDTAKDQHFLRFYARSLLRGYCSGASNTALKNAISENSNSSLGTTKALKIALQDDQRCLSMKSLVVK
jgi:aminopeptidase N